MKSARQLDRTPALTTPSESKRVLIIGPSWVGDMVMTQALAKAIKKRQPETRIDMLAPGWSLPIVSRMPEVENGLEMPLGHGRFAWSVRRHLGLSLRGHGYDQALVLPRSFKSALVPFHARIPVRTGYRGEMRFGLINDMRKLDKTVLPQTVQRFAALGAVADQVQPPQILRPRLTVSQDNKNRLIRVLSLDTSGPVVAFMPGAEYGPSKCWPLEYFATLAAHIGSRGGKVWVLGSEKDKAAGERIREGSPDKVANLCGKTQLEDVIDLIDLSVATVTNDSGLMHIAAAVETQMSSRQSGKIGDLQSR